MKSCPYPLLCDIEHLNVQYDNHSALLDISVSIPSGKLVAICGPNGAGKSTLLKTLLGLIRKQSGKVQFIETIHPGYMPQRQNIDWDFPITVFELVLMGSYHRMRRRLWITKEEKNTAHQLLARVGLSEYADRQISQLSGGQQGRAFLARALMLDAPAYFLDEPFAGIDLASSQVILSILQTLRDEGKSIVVVHHDLACIRQYFDWALLMNRRLITSGPVGDVLTESWLQIAYGTAQGLFDEVTQLGDHYREGALK